MTKTKDGEVIKGRKVKHYIKKIEKYYEEKYRNDDEIFTFIIDFNGLENINEITVKHKIAKDSQFLVFHNTIFYFFELDLGMDVLVQLYKQGSKNIKDILVFTKCSSSPEGCIINNDEFLTFSELLDREFDYDLIEQIDIKTYRINIK